MLTTALRNRIAAHPELGAANFLEIAARTIQAPDHPFWHLHEGDRRLFNGEVHSALSVNDVLAISGRLAAWYATQALEPGARVGLYLGSGIDYFFHYFALSRLGLVPVWLNSRLATDVAGHFLRHVGARLVLADQDRCAALADVLGPDCRVAAACGLPLPGPDVAAPAPWRHQDDDVVLICHSSGTTGMPKPVMYHHRSMCYGIRQFLAQPPEFATVPTRDGHHRLLSVLPPAHHSSLTYLMRGLLSQMDFMTLGQPDAAAIAAAITAFQPSVVMSFPCHYVSLAALDKDTMPYDFSSVCWWLSVGDAAHRPHIRRLLQHGYHSTGNGYAPGSVFIDGLGSSEMGSIFFRQAHAPGDSHPLRCVGRPLPWVEAAVLSDQGAPLPPGSVGRLGVRAPTLASYWQQAEMESASWLSGYFLTGDLVRSDEHGNYYHMDRVSDAIHTAGGVMYTAMAEETILDACAEIEDCVVVGVPAADGAQIVQLAGFLAVKPGAACNTDSLLARINTALQASGQLRLDAIQLTSLAALPTGPTGKIQKNRLRAALSAQPPAGQPCQ